MTHTYTATVTASNPQDATDIVRRRAWDDGYRVATVRRVVIVAEGRVYSVELAVRKRE